jgi:hypothetical protein
MRRVASRFSPPESCFAAYKIKIDWIVALLVLLKNVVQPALVLGGLLWLGYGGPVVARAVLTTAIRRCQS